MRPIPLLLITLAVGWAIPMLHADGHINIGDQVEVNWVGQWKKATVTDVKRNGWVTVKLKEKSGHSMTPTLPGAKVRKIGKDGQVVANPGDKYQAGEKVEAFWGEGWWPGTVVNKNARKQYMVKVDYKGKDRVMGMQEAHMRKPGETKAAPHKVPMGKNYIGSVDLRGWELSSGKKLPEATLFSYTERGSKVLLKQANGVCRAYELGELRKSDQAYVMQQIKAKAQK
jgi:hypothetical protein